MNFFNSIKYCIDKKYADFKSRASRSEFWYFTLFVVICLPIAMLLSKLIVFDFLKIKSDDPETEGAFIIIFYYIILSPIIIPAFSVSVRRLHDLNLSGWLICFMFPFMYLDEYFGTDYIFNIVALIIFYSVCSLKGTNGKNKYGDKPKK
tara:strand:- start:26 stop:472 length:447 start_codon:yes stop_codon:yes gene_type:complete